MYYLYGYDKTYTHPDYSWECEYSEFLNENRDLITSFKTIQEAKEYVEKAELVVPGGGHRFKATNLLRHYQSYEIKEIA